MVEDLKFLKKLRGIFFFKSELQWIIFLTCQKAKECNPSDIDKHLYFSSELIEDTIFSQNFFKLVISFGNVLVQRGKIFLFPRTRIQVVFLDDASIELLSFFWGLFSIFCEMCPKNDGRPWHESEALFSFLPVWLFILTFPRSKEKETESVWVSAGVLKREREGRSGEGGIAGDAAKA